MKKLVKMSLVAAVAVAGLSTTASAKSMEESIKGVDFSGYVRYRYTNGADNAESHKYKTVFKVKSKVNDSVNAFIKVTNESAVDDASGDADPTHAAVKCANFQMNLGGNTVIVGKQGLQTPFAALSDQQGTGIVAVAPMGAMTLAGGWYFNTDATAGVGGADLGGLNIAAIAAMGKAGAVDYAAWLADVSNGATAMNLNVAGTVGAVNLELNHASVDYDVGANPTQTRVVASGKAGAATVAAGVVMTGDEGGDVTLGDVDAQANFDLEDLSAHMTTDDTVIYVGVHAPVGATTVGLEYAAADEADADETMLSVAYKMSSNFKISGFATSGDLGDKTRLEVKYTF